MFTFESGYFGSLKSPPSQISYDLGHRLFKISYFIWSPSLVIFHQLWSLIGVSVAFQGCFFFIEQCVYYLIGYISMK